MKTSYLIALALGACAGLASAAEPASYSSYSPEVAALRYECAAKYYASEYSSKYYSQQAYDKGEYAGKSQCSEAQYASYLQTADPMKVMAAYPTAAGKPGYKKEYSKDAKYEKDPQKYDKDYDTKYDKDEKK